MEKFLTLYIYANVPAQFLFDDGKGVTWDNGGKILMVNLVLCLFRQRSIQS